MRLFMVRLLRLRVRLRSKQKYEQQRNTAKQRGIPFHFTFMEWWQFWKSSGHWQERGKRSGQYVVARKGDRGAYELGNVEIVPCHINHSSRIRACKHGARKREQWRLWTRRCRARKRLGVG